MVKNPHKLANVLNPNPFRFSVDVIPTHFKPAAVLLPVWQGNEGLTTLLTKRSSKLAKHGGEICFPGGKLEAGETHGEAALRETEEEIGLKTESFELVGRLDDAWSGAGYHIQPYVGYLESDPTEHLSEQMFSEEVEAVYAINLESPLNVQMVSWSKNGREYTDPVIQHGTAKIYGLTADMLLELVDQLQGNSHSRGRDRMHYLQLFHAK